VALLGKLPQDRYEHFLTLHVAAKILSSSELCLQFNDYAKSLLMNFVSNARVLYGDAFITLNIHCLLHLADDVAKFGPMQTFWAFFFENDLGVIGRMFTKGAYPLQQIVKRIYEAETNLIKKNLDCNQVSLRKEHRDGPLTDHCPRETQFKYLSFGNIPKYTETKQYCNDK
jgi:hypothetical protein